MKVKVNVEGPTAPPSVGEEVEFEISVNLGDGTLLSPGKVKIRHGRPNFFLTDDSAKKLVKCALAEDYTQEAAEEILSQVDVSINDRLALIAS